MPSSAAAKFRPPRPSTSARWTGRTTAALRRDEPERLFCLINAPATGDTHGFEKAEVDSCESRVFQLLADFGLQRGPTGSDHDR